MPNSKQIIAIAACVGCDCRTVRSYFEGGHTLPIYAKAIADAWARIRAGESVPVAIVRGDVDAGIRRDA